MSELKVIQYDYKHRFGKENDYAKELMSDYVEGKKMDTVIELKPTQFTIAGETVEEFLQKLEKLIEDYRI